MIKIDKDRFKELINEYDYNKQRNTIGILKEKSIHSILKNYIDSNINNQEIKVDGYVCDIYDGKEIYEIQTIGLDKLRVKLNALGKDYIINVIHPIARIKKVAWIDKETGEISSYHMSPKKATIYDALKELYKIKMCLDNPNIKVHIMFLECIEYRNLDGYGKTKKRYSTRHEMIATDLLDIYSLDSKSKYLSLLGGLIEFTNDVLSKHVKTSIRNATILTNILSYLDIIEVIRKDGRKNVYKVKKVE